MCYRTLKVYTNQSEITTRFKKIIHIIVERLHCSESERTFLKSKFRLSCTQPKKTQLKRLTNGQPKNLKFKTVYLLKRRYKSAQTRQKKMCIFVLTI